MNSGSHKNNHPVFPDMQKPYNIAHQGGELLAPSNTIAAFDLALSLGVTFIETDIHMTRDGHLVVSHDPTVDRLTNGSGRIDTYSLEELKQLDAGYHFQDLQGRHSYRGQGVTIPALEEVFQRYGERCYINIDMKEPYPRQGPSQVEEKLWALIQKYHIEEHVIVASFHQELVDQFARIVHGRVLLSAGISEVTRFVLTHKLHLYALYHPRCHVIQIPTRARGLNLKDRRLIAGAHRLGMQIHYWTIDDRPTMEELIELGADGIITNRPDILAQVLQEVRIGGPAL